MPIEHRPRVVRTSTAHRAGGAFILVEKVLGNSAPTDDLMTRLYYGLKRANGYGEEEIERKRLASRACSSRSRPLERGSPRAGRLREVECFWRCLNFAGWVAIKDRRVNTTE